MQEAREQGIIDSTLAARPELGGDGTLLTDVGGGKGKFPLGRMVSCPLLVDISKGQLYTQVWSSEHR